MKKVLLLILGAALSGWAAPGNRKLSAEMTIADALTPVRVVVQWNSAADDTKDRKVLSRGGTVHYRFKSLPAGVYTLTGAAVRDLANDPDVSYISPDRAVSPKLDLTAAAVNASTLWNAGWNGSGVGVAVIDSGINADPNLGPGRSVVFSFDFTNPINANAAANYLALLGSAPLLPSLLGGLPVSALSTPAPDQYGHGQHVSGIIASNGLSSTCANCTRTFAGIAPGVNLLDLRVLDQNGESNDSTVILAIDTAIALKNIYNIRVINLSLGRAVYESYPQDPLCQAVEAAWNAGIAVVVAAGNDGRDDTYGEQGYGTINAPGNDPLVITVGAMKTEGTPTRADDLIATYSSKGPTQIDHIVKPDIVAPGNLVVSLLVQNSTLANEYPANMVPLTYFETNLSPGQAKRNSPNYFILSGTSMATAVVSGAVADLVQAKPSLTPDQVKALLMDTASKSFPQSSTVTDPTTGQTFTDYYDIFTVGAGYIDLAAALSSINNVPANGTAWSPVASYQSGNGAVTLAFDPSSIWSQQAVWGTNSVWASQSVWGTSVLQGSQAVWGTQSVWGTNSVWAANSVWGAQAVWGTNSMWATNSKWAANSMWATNSTSAQSAPIAIVGEQ
jgi:serine protease AprX